MLKVSRWKYGDFASAVEDLQEQDSQLTEELQRVAGEAEELRKKSEEAVWEVSGRLIGAEDDLERDDPRPEEEASTVRSAASVRPKLQDLAQFRSRRFAEELEFVQCLANPSYVMWLASQGFLGDTGFAHFLDYLCYWRRPQYVRYAGFLNGDPKDHLPGVPGDAGSSAGSSSSRTAPANRRRELPEQQSAACLGESPGGSAGPRS
ncbi:SOH1 [Symbiodinium sp. CCMP2456]|nr:SOH1 [Symbiodinium sp. CCMP2456]